MQRSKEAEEMDVDIRANLLDLKHSRLYSSKDRRPHHHSPPAPAGMVGAEKSHVEAADGATDFQGKSTLPPREEL
nr:hypothetical protein BaRGS_007415 [Batillaria attramentaria]